MFADVVDDADIGVIQGSSGPSLTQKSLLGEVYTGVGRAGGRRACGCFRSEKTIRDELDGDFALEPGVQRAINIAHAAGAYLFNDLVRSKDSSRGDHQRPKAFGFTSQ